MTIYQQDLLRKLPYSELHGFMFTTWEAYVKEAFAVRAGLIDKDHVFSEDEAADLYRCVNHTREDCENLTYEQEQKLKSL